MQVTAPDGRVWVVRRRPGRSPQWRSMDWADPFYSGGGLSFGGGSDLSDIVAGLVITIVAAILFVLVVAFLLPALIFGGEAIIIVLGLLVLAAPWRVEATTGGPPEEEMSWRVRGVLRSRRAVREVAKELRHGVEAEPEDAER